MGEETMDITHIGQLKSDKKNARRHGERNIGMIEDALHEVGAARSIVIDEDNVILAGNGVVEAAAQAGIERVRVVEADGETIIAVRRTGLTPEQKKRLALYDNRTAELADWDAEVLAGLRAEDERLLAGLWGKDELAELLKDVLPESAEDPGPQVDKADELQKKWGTALGQIWEIPSKTVPGKAHRLMCGDSTKAEDVARLMAGEKATLMVTDPPYGIALDQGWRDRVGINRLGKAQSDLIQGDDSHSWTEAWLLFGGDVVYVWHAGIKAGMVGKDLEMAGFEIRGQIIWIKPVHVLSRGHYHGKHEPCWYAVRKGSVAHWQGDRSQMSVWESASPHQIMSGSDEEKFDHPTQKPVDIMAHAIRNHAGDVYDPFLGSGTTMVAAEQLGRLCYGMEIEPKYVAVSLQRMADMGLEPRLCETP